MRPQRRENFESEPETPAAIGWEYGGQAGTTISA